MKHRFRNCYKNVSKFKKLLSTERGLYAESHEEEIVNSNHNAGRSIRIHLYRINFNRSKKQQRKIFRKVQINSAVENGEQEQLPERKQNREEPLL